MRWPMAEVELLENWMQLTPMTYATTDLPLRVPPDGPGSTKNKRGCDQLLVRMPQARTTVTRRSGADT